MQDHILSQALLSRLRRFYLYQGSTIGFRVLYLYSPCNKVITVVGLNSKGGEGNPKSKQGNHIFSFSSSLYEAILKAHPELNCTI